MPVTSLSNIATGKFCSAKRWGTDRTVVATEKPWKEQHPVKHTPWPHKVLLVCHDSDCPPSARTNIVVTPTTLTTATNIHQLIYRGLLVLILFSRACTGQVRIPSVKLSDIITSDRLGGRVASTSLSVQSCLFVASFWLQTNVRFCIRSDQSIVIGRLLLRITSHIWGLSSYMMRVVGVSSSSMTVTVEK